VCRGVHRGTALPERRRYRRQTSRLPPGSVAVELPPGVLENAGVFGVFGVFRLIRALCQGLIRRTGPLPALATSSYSVVSVGHSA
jgi:hypothetical protein